MFKFDIGLNAKHKKAITLTTGIKLNKINQKNFQAETGLVIGFSLTVENASCFDVKAVPQVLQYVSFSLIGALQIVQFIFSPL